MIAAKQCQLLSSPTATRHKQELCRDEFIPKVLQSHINNYTYSLIRDSVQNTTNQDFSLVLNDIILNFIG